MNAERIDVLAVMDAARDALSQNATYPADVRFALARIAEARAAVAELIDKADFVVDGLGDEAVIWPMRVSMLRAALARIAPPCPGCRETLDGKLVCCDADAARAHEAAP